MPFAFGPKFMKAIFLLLLVFNTFVSFSQNISSRLIKYPDNNLTIYGSIDNGDILFLYGIAGDENTGTSPLIIKMHSNGDVLWAKIYTGFINTLIRSACLNETNGVTLIGNSVNSSDDDIIILKLTDEGNIEWSKTYGGNDHERGFKIIQLDDNSYIASGSTRSIGSGEEDSFVMRIDAFGNQIWDRTLGGTYRDNAFDVIYSNDNTLVFTGAQSSFGSGGYDFGLGKMDLSGNLLFLKAIGSHLFSISRLRKIVFRKS